MKKLGFGTMRLPLIPGGKQTDIDFEQVKQMFDYFLEKGFTYVDTAYMYHDYTSEMAVRECLVKRHPRESFLLADKMPVASVETPADYPRIFAEQLEKTGAGYFDYYLLHDLTRNDIDIAENGGFDFVVARKAEGLVKHIGFSYHDDAILLEEILRKHPEMEFVQLQLNYADWNDSLIQAKANYDVCVKYGKQVWVMEPVKGGALAKVPEELDNMFKAYAPDASPASWAVRFAATHENVAMVLSGMSSMEQMIDNTSYMVDFRPLNEEEMAIVEKGMQIIKTSFAVKCTGCRYCVNHAPGCPMNIAIPEYFALYNLVHQYGNSWSTKQAYLNLVKDYGAPSACISCGQCEHHCPQHINIIETLKEVPTYQA